MNVLLLFISGQHGPIIYEVLLFKNYALQNHGFIKDHNHTAVQSPSYKLD